MNTVNHTQMYRPPYGPGMGAMGVAPTAPPRYSSLHATDARPADSRTSHSSEASSIKSGSGVSFDSRRSSSDSSKPRLSREQHGFLEQRFHEHNKPTTNAKKGYAAQLGVPLDKVNNWFQNRRAKVKHEARRQRGQEQPYQQFFMSNGVARPVPGPGQHIDPHWYQGIPGQPNYMSLPFQNGPQPGPQPGPELNPDAFSDPLQDMNNPHGHVDVGHFDQSNIYHPYNADPNLNFLGLGPGPIRSEDVYSLRQEFPSLGHEAAMYSIAEETEDADPNTSKPTHQNNIGPLPTQPGQSDDPTAFNEFGQDPVDFASFLMPSGQYPQPTDDSNLQFPLQSWEESARANEDEHRFPDASHSAALPYRLHAGQAGHEGSTLQFSAFHQPHFGPQPVVPSQPEQPLRHRQSHPDRLSRVDSVTQHRSPTTPNEGNGERRESTVSSLAGGVGNLEVQHSDLSLPKNSAGGSLAARRQGRPAPIRTTSGGLRGAFAAGAPSPRNLNPPSTDNLRRIKSSSVLHGSGRVQKSGPNAVQRSPMSLTFKDAELARTMSSQSMTNLNGKMWRHDDSVPMTPASPNHSDFFAPPPSQAAPPPLPIVPSAQGSQQAHEAMMYSAPTSAGLMAPSFFSHGPLIPTQHSNGSNGNFASPPSTPSLNMTHNSSSQFQSTPSSQGMPMSLPSSAPAWQQGFNTGLNMQQLPEAWIKLEGQPMSGPEMMHNAANAAASDGEHSRQGSMAQIFVNGPDMYRYQNMPGPGQPIPYDMQMPMAPEAYAAQARAHAQAQSNGHLQIDMHGHGQSQSPPSVNSLEHTPRQHSTDKEQTPIAQNMQLPGQGSATRPPSRYMTTWDSTANSTRMAASPTKSNFHFQSWNPSDMHKVAPEKLPPRSRDGSAQYGEFVFHNMTPSSLQASLSSPVRS